MNSMTAKNTAGISPARKSVAISLQPRMVKKKKKKFEPYDLPLANIHVQEEIKVSDGLDFDQTEDNITRFRKQIRHRDKKLEL